MGAGLLAKAVYQPTSILNVMAPSRASPLPHLEPVPIEEKQPFRRGQSHANQTLDQWPTDRRRRPRPTGVQPGPRSCVGGNQRSQ
ncbi:hypothetical protein CUN63_18945 [Pseudomonas sp. ACM7]|nr:hypothetical protein CUN63_18945 [Pseudomonas sp. ACM7]